MGHAAAAPRARDVSLEARACAEGEERRGDGDAHAAAGVGGFVLREQAARAQRDRPGGGEHATALAARHRRVGRRDVGVQRRGRSGGDPRGARVAAARAGGAPDAAVRFVPLDVRVLDVDDGGARHLAWVARSVHLIARRDEDGAPVRRRVVLKRAARGAKRGGRRGRGGKSLGAGGVGFGGVGFGVDVWLERHGAAAEHAGAAPLLVHLDGVPGEDDGSRRSRRRQIRFGRGTLDLDHAASGGEHAAAARRGDVF